MNCVTREQVSEAWCSLVKQCLHLGINFACPTKALLYSEGSSTDQSRLWLLSA